MNDIDRWFEHAGRRENRSVSLYTSLLTGKLFAYFGYRLRFTLLIATARFAVHVLEFLILISSLGGLAAYTVMVLRIASMVVGGGWWGLLEVMRERIRGFFLAGERDAAETEIGRWLVLSLFAALTLASAVGAALVVLRPSGHDPVAQVYAFLVVLELAIGFPVRVIHSGVYATRRIYRPIWSMFARTLVQLGLLTVGFYYYPTTAIIVAIIASNAIGIWITVHYTLEVYRLTGLWPRTGQAAYAVWRLLPKIPLWQGVQTALCGLALRLDAVLVLAIVGVYGTSTRSFDLTAGVSAWRHVDAFQFFYLVLPLLCGAYEGAGLFYFDFVRLRSNPALAEFRVYFFHKLLWVMPAIGVFFWSLAAALAMFVLHDVPFSFLLALLPLFVVRSVIGSYQIRLFAEGHSGTHIASLGLLAVLLWLVWMDRNPASDLIQITAALTTELIVLINVQHFWDRRPPPLPTLLTLGDWIRSLAHEPGPVHVGAIALAKSITPKQRSAAMSLMRQTFGDHGHFAFRSPTALVYYQRSANGDLPPEHHLMLQTATGGAAHHGARLSAPMVTGRGALDRLVTEKWIPPNDGNLAAPESLEDLRCEFRTLFPDGIVFDVATLDGSRDMRDLEQGLLAQALPTAAMSLEGGVSVVPLSGRGLTPIYRRGRLRLLLVLPRDPQPALFKRWLHVVRMWHIAWGTKEIAESVGDG
ncbi:hypothetical protein MB901379_03145 [Mycobacterium basiliense]|uniref:Uncharacterized protein n=1 Tax=Mycobacterium basiliense TaxID=2094119 RepID=A0A447GGD4_9MYCO|nr:hypothetical protein [Mycobacterium basiliense]VDM89567.1 hypothetical protein MB901379_03145 [Mycobacterium basiliense]